MASNLNLLPTTLIAGESINETITGVTKSGTLVYKFGSDTPLSVDCSEGDTYFELTVTSAQTLTFKNGNIKYAAYQTIDDTTICVDFGVISVTASPAATSDYATVLTAVESAIASYGTNTNKKVKVGELEIEYRDLNDLLALRNFYKNEIAKDTGRGSRGGPYMINTEFR